jgi:hypothetical protein
MNKVCVFILLLFNFISFGQTFDEPAGQIGSLAIHKDSSVIVNWANGIQVSRGYLNISNPSLGVVGFGLEQDAFGQAEGDGTSVVSLGDGGTAVLTFSNAIMNLAGPDFAVFENGFTDDYMEFAHVEVSSDGVNYFRFPSISEIPLTIQTDNFSFVDCRYVYNLAGKYRQGYGVPFDLEELVGIANLDINAITHIKLIDVIGSIDAQFGSTDNSGYLINDPYPTEFDSGGFDLDAVAVINEAPANIIESDMNFSVSPNPTTGIIQIISNEQGVIRFYNVIGVLQGEQETIGYLETDLRSLNEKIIFVQFTSKNSSSSQRLILLN